MLERRKDRAVNEQDWCVECEAPADIIDDHLETYVQTVYGTGPEYRAVDLSCGHSIALPTGRWA